MNSKEETDFNDSKDTLASFQENFSENTKTEYLCPRVPQTPLPTAESPTLNQTKVKIVISRLVPLDEPQSNEVNKQNLQDTSDTSDTQSSQDEETFREIEKLEFEYKDYPSIGSENEDVQEQDMTDTFQSLKIREKKKIKIDLHKMALYEFDIFPKIRVLTPTPLRDDFNSPRYSNDEPFASEILYHGSITPIDLL